MVENGNTLECSCMRFSDSASDPARRPPFVRSIAEYSNFCLARGFCLGVFSSVNAPHHSSQPAAPTHRGGGATFYVVLTLIAAGAGVAFWLGALPKQARLEEARKVSRDLSRVRVRTAQPAPAQEAKELSLSGELKPVSEASILARVSGYVRYWKADLGDHVQEGQVLAELDTPELQREIARARAQIAVCEAARNLSEKTAHRWRELLAAKTASAQEADEKDADFQLRIAALDAAKADLNRLEEIAGFAKITAPFAGTITVRGIDLGQLVEAGGQRELYKLADIRRLRVFVRVPQSYARSVAVGQAAELRLPELHGQTFPATVIRMAGAIDAASRTLLVELEADNKTGRLLAGSYTQVRLCGASQDSPLTVPATALIFRAEGAQVAVVDSSNVAHLRSVALGRDFGTSVQILEGVGPEDQVVLNPPDSLTDGITVERVQ
jgi:membrane fusion protein (multidrug efflux system)